MFIDSLRRGAIALVVYFCLSPGLALAAEMAFVAKVEGTITGVLRGDKVLPVSVQMPLSPSDRLIAGTGSSIVVRYIADGCVAQVESGNSLVVERSSQCVLKPASTVARDMTIQYEPERRALKIVPAREDPILARVVDRTGWKHKANLGDGLVALKSGARLKEGDVVFAGADSTVTLYFENEPCEFVVEPESSLTISASDPPCRAVAQSANSKELALPSMIPPVLGPVPSMVTAGMLLSTSAVTIMGFRGDSDPVTP